MTTSADVVLAVDVGGTKISAATVDRAGTCGPLLLRATPAAEGPEAVIGAIVDLAREAARGRAFAAVAVATAGVVDPVAGTVLSASDSIAGWAGTRLAERLSDLLDASVIVENDARAHAVGELWLGAGRGAGSLLMLAIGTGIGGAVVLDGQVLHGAHLVAGEVGHLPARGAEHLLCPCGRPGHLEAMSSGHGVLRHYRFLGGPQTVTDTRRILELAREDDALALRALGESAGVLGITLASLVMVLDPDVVVLGGGLVDAGPLWWEPMEAALRSELIDVVADVVVRPAELGGRAPLIGAARRAWTHLD